MLDTKRFKRIIETFHENLLKTHDEITDIRLTEDKWSLREIIGHLIDSASNNHQRFVRLQFGNLLDFPAYDGEEWIRTQKYNSMNWDVLITLWYKYNCLLLHVIENAGKITFENVWVKNEDAVLLGAGASIESGIHSANDCIWEWKKDIFISQNPHLVYQYKSIKAETVRKAIQQWLDSQGVYPKLGDESEYSFYAEKANPILGDRQRYFQRLSEGKEPIKPDQKKDLKSIIICNNIGLNDLSVNYDKSKLDISKDWVLDAKEIGEFVVTLVFEDIERTLNVSVKKKIPYFSLTKTIISLNEGNTVNLRDYIGPSSCIDTSSSTIQIKVKNAATIINDDLFSKDNKIDQHNFILL